MKRQKSNELEKSQVKLKEGLIESSALEELRENFINAIDPEYVHTENKEKVLERRGIAQTIINVKLLPFIPTPNQRGPELRAQFKINPEAVFFEADPDSVVHFHLYYQSKNEGIKIRSIAAANVWDAMKAIQVEQLKQEDIDELKGWQKFKRSIAQWFADTLDKFNMGPKIEPTKIVLEQPSSSADNLRKGVSVESLKPPQLRHVRESKAVPEDKKTMEQNKPRPQ